MKINFRKILAITIFFACSVGFMTGCSYHFSFSSGPALKKEDAKEFTLEKTAAEAINCIDIQTRNADIDFISSDKFYVEINYLYWEEQPEYSLEDGRLFFSDKDAFPDSYSINFNPDNSIKVYLPVNAALTDLEIDSASGNVSLMNFVADDAEVNLAYGNLTIENAAAAKASINLASGDSKLTDFQSGNLEFASSYGDSDFTDINTGDPRLSEDITYNDVRIESSSGDIMIDKLDCNSIKLRNSYGNIRCKNINANQLDSTLSSGDITLSKSDILDLSVEDSYGDADLSMSGSEADYSLDLSTSYGGIKVGDKKYEDRLKQDHDGARQLTANLSSGDIRIHFENE